MKFRLRYCLLVFLAVVGPAAAAEPTGELIDRVWSGHPVSFALLVERGYQFIAYYDAERRITVLGRRLGATAWTRVQPPGVPLPARKRASNVIGWDSHNTLRLALDRDGCLHLSGNMHADPLVYYRTRMPFDVATLERIDRMTGARENRCTYPVFFKNTAGDLLFRYRDGGSGNGSDLYNIYEAVVRTWRRLLDTPLLEGEGERNAYASAPILGPDGRFHLAWVWRETPDAATNHSLSYARSRDLIHWENSRGDPIALPIVLATSDVIDPAKPGEGLINMTFSLGFDAAQQPVVVYHRYDAQRRSQAYAARPRRGAASVTPPGDAAGRGTSAAAKWDIRQISNWNFTWAFSGGGSIVADVRLGALRVDRDGTLLVDFWTVPAGAGRWRLRADTLEPIAQLPALPNTLPATLRRVQSEYPGMEVQSISARTAGRHWVLRWETLGRNRDKPRAVAPPPTELRLYELTGSDTATDERIGL